MRPDPWILGISASHNGSVCLLHGDRIVVAIQEERLSRIKRQRIQGAAPALSLLYCLQYAGIDASQIDMIVICTQGRGGAAANDVYRNPLLRPHLHGIPVVTIPHHVGHAISAFALSGFDTAAVMVIDGMGSSAADLLPEEQAVILGRPEDGFETISLYHASGIALQPLEKHVVDNGQWIVPRHTSGMPSFGSLGGMFAAAASQIFGDFSEAGKVMGLAPFGNQRFQANNYFEVESDGSLAFFDWVPNCFRSTDRWPAHRECYQDLARSTQAALDEAVLLLAQRLRARTNCPRLCYAGGVALNSVTNDLLCRKSGFQEIFVVPAAEDSGPAIGAAYYGLWRLLGEKQSIRLLRDACGRLYHSGDVLAAAARVGVGLAKTHDAVRDAVDLLCDGVSIGWFTGGAELGPRALGQRSILSDPRRRVAKEDLNKRVKHRESFRPFAPSVLLEDAGTWFDIDDGIDLLSPFMLRVRTFASDRRDQVPAVVHVDGTGRLQTVTEKANGTFYNLVNEFRRRTGVPMLLNTSFNGQGEPIVETPEDAMRCVLNTGLECCVFPNYIAFRG